MYQTDSLLTFSFPMGRLMGVPLRLSFLMPVVVVALMWRLGDVAFGAIASAILLLSLLLHEVAHLVMARRARCRPATVVLWPLGGMQTTHARQSFRECLSISAAGPLLNLAVAAGCGWQLQRLGLLRDLLNPFVMFDLGASENLAHNCLRMTFVVNFYLGIFNLIPVRPLDGGQAFSAFLNLRFVEIETRDLMLRIGLVVSLFGILSGFVFDMSSLVALSAFLLILHIHEVTQLSPPEERDDSFMGYDFSEGYTSLGRRDETESLREIEDEESRAGIVERWKTRREEEREQRELREQELEEQQLDRILAKLHTDGRESLTVRELSVLNRVSARLRQRNVQE